MEKEDLARAQAFQSRLEVLKKSELRFESSSGALIKQEMEQEEKRTRAAMEMKYKADEDREREKQLKRKADMAKSLEFNKQMMEKKVSAREQEKELSVARRQQLEKEVRHNNHHSIFFKKVKILQGCSI